MAGVLTRLVDWVRKRRRPLPEAAAKPVEQGADKSAPATPALALPPAPADPKAAHPRPTRSGSSAPRATTTEDPLVQLVRAAESQTYPEGADPLALLDARLDKPDQADAALRLLYRLVAARSHDADLRLGFAERLLGRMLTEPARALLEPLLADPAHRLRARYRLAELHERQGDLTYARVLYEEVVAEDIDYENARARAERLRPAPAAAPVTPPPTLLALEGEGARAARYHLLAELGRGSAATVFLARDDELGRELAVKVLHPQLYGQAHAAARSSFFSEARIAASLPSRAIVAIYDIDESRQLIAMEHCARGSLRLRLRQGPIAPKAALGITSELLAALATLHASGVMHGDVKPGNLLFRSSGELVLGDFGTARLVPRSAEPGERAWRPAGTVLYMAPEQLRGTPPRASHDLYAAGVVLLEMLTGSAPLSFEAALRGDTPAPEPPATLELPEHVRGALRALLAGCLAADPDARFADAATAQSALRAAEVALAVSAVEIAQASSS
jgi:tRNA A-37 threonylcarbamoyl transferase component Bud32